MDYPGFTVSLISFCVALAVGLAFWFIILESRRRKRRNEEELKRRVKEMTGQDFVKGYTTVKDLEKMYGKKG